MAAIDTEGYILSTDPAVIATGPDAGYYVIRFLTLYNPNSTAVNFIIRKVVTTETTSEMRVIRFDDQIPSLDCWPYGLNGMPIMLVRPGARYEVVLDSAPTLGIHWACDMGIST